MFRRNVLSLSLCLIGALVPALAGVGGSPTPGSAEAATKVTPQGFAEHIRRARTVVIAFEEFRNKRESMDAVVEDRAWIEKLAEIVAAGPLVPQPYCFCVSTPTVEIYGQDGLMLRLSLHHHTKLRSFGVVKGDYDIGKERSQAILALLIAERANARERVIPKLKWPEKK